VALPSIDWWALALQLLSWAGPAAFALAVRLWRQGVEALSTFREAMRGVAVLLNRDRRELDLLRRVVFHVSTQEFSRLTPAQQAAISADLEAGVERMATLRKHAPFLARLEDVVVEINELRDTAWKADVFREQRVARRLQAWAGRARELEVAHDHGDVDTSYCGVIEREAKKR
jgi:hypothetical protein